MQIENSFQNINRRMRSQEAFAPGSDGYDRAKMRHDSAKQEVEQARDFFLAQDNVAGVDQNGASGEVSLRNAASGNGDKSVYNGDLAADGNFSYKLHNSPGSMGGLEGASETNAQGETAYYSYSDPSPFEVLTHYSISHMSDDGTIFVESGIK